VPPLPEDWDKAAPPPAEADDDFVLPVAYSENQLAYTFTDRHADTLRYVHDWGDWLRWDTGLWCEDHAVTVYDAARVICAQAGETAVALEKTGKRIAALINRAACIAAIERLARHHHRHVLTPVDFDADPLLLNGSADSHAINNGEPT
jgi:hypothetical protein